MYQEKLWQKFYVSENIIYNNESNDWYHNDSDRHDYDTNRKNRDYYHVEYGRK